MPPRWRALHPCGGMDRPRPRHGNGGRRFRRGAAVAKCRRRDARAHPRKTGCRCDCGRRPASVRPGPASTSARCATAGGSPPCAAIRASWRCSTTRTTTRRCFERCGGFQPPAPRRNTPAATQRLKISAATNIRPGNRGVSKVSFSSISCTGFAVSCAKS